MSHRIMTLLFSGAIGITVTGCMTASPVTRAQNLPVQGASWGQPLTSASCPNCQSHNGELNLPFHPVHRNSYTYNTPKNLMYPDASSSAGIVQYPYYTFRGPTDYFME